MHIDTIVDIFLNELRGTREDNLITLPHGTKVTIFFGVPAGVLPITKVDQVQLGEQVVIFRSDEGRVFVGRDEVVAMRADQEANSRKDVKLGFG